MPFPASRTDKESKNKAMKVELRLGSPGHHERLGFERSWVYIASVDWCIWFDIAAETLQVKWTFFTFRWFQYIFIHICGGLA